MTRNIEQVARTCFGYTGWSWLNPPAAWTPDEDALEITTAPDSDFWNTTHYGFVRDSGHALLRPVPAGFRLRTTFSGDYHAQYDQAGLLLRVDEKNWIKTGIEYVDGQRQVSAVVTRDVSDWNVVPLDRSTPTRAPVTIELQRSGDTVTVRYGTGGTAPDTLLRLAYFPPDAEAQAGPMCASPDGPGFTAWFTDLRLTDG
ncbi:hypothetical protein GCM10018793_11040 [Streptomyces sulfonofaciens]|uniref:DUF1349 domain-containing protein n=1 Tax=Streptomyces sulfonofaciens TaxID=68272 RepID=A0A919FVC1_9ACTN|nr:DUF1349 domain-containing protein [Streptomyces sulfonofaciens]GHH73041.1 hypothetical protein GCM10018793_11040 [Streptomyces sulfonofaciens]